MTTDDAINPRHYSVHPSGVQCIEISRWLSADLAQAFQYVWRCGQKDDPVQDLKKAIWFIEDEMSINNDDKHTINYLKIGQNITNVLSYESGHKRDALAHIVRANVQQSPTPGTIRFCTHLVRANVQQSPRLPILYLAIQSIKEMIREYECANK